MRVYIPSGIFFQEVKEWCDTWLGYFGGYDEKTGKGENWNIFKVKEGKLDELKTELTKYGVPHRFEEEADG